MLLKVEQINTFYGDSHILFDVSLEVGEHQCVALLGRNGAGKTTTFRSIMGLTAPRHGTITYRGQPIQGKPAYWVAQQGIGLVPEERAIFPTLTVWENLDVARKPSPEGQVEWTVERIYTLFPRLKERHNQLGRTLSGGEQQMLTIARTLMGNPHLLLLDEPSEGLSPIMVETIGTLIRDLKSARIAILLAEQNLDFTLELSEHVYIIDDGHIRFSGASVDLMAQPEIVKKYLAVQQVEE